MQSIDDYADWTTRLWLSSGRAEADERDLTVMGFGLPGEMGEAIEHLLDDDFNQDDAKKELGDVFYYWARLNRFFGLDPSVVLARQQGAGQPVTDIDAFAHWACASEPDEDALRRGLRLAGATSRVMERLKKRVRDRTFDVDALAGDLGVVAMRWCRLCNAFALEPSDVLAANVAKIEDRRARGVMRGSGNHR